MAHLTPDQRAAEKLRLKKIQEEGDLKIGLETLGLTMPNSSIESFNPSTKEEFTEFAEAISKTVTQFRAKADYVSFVDDLVRSLCAGCKLKKIINFSIQINLLFFLWFKVSSINIRKVKASVDSLYLEKQKLEKGDKPKKKPAAKVKATLRMEGDVRHNKL